MKERKEDAKKLASMQSLKKINDSLYTLDCSHDIYIDEMVEQGRAGSIGKMLAFAIKRVTKKPVIVKEPRSGCSVFTAFNEKGENIMGRNFDYKDAPCILVKYAPEKGYKSIGFTDANFFLWGKKRGAKEGKHYVRTLLAPYLCVDGINEKGLAVSVLELKTPPLHQKTGKLPISTSIIIRMVLNYAETIEEAIELFKSYDMNDIGGVAYHFVVSDRSGKSVLIEYLNGEMMLFYPESREGSEKFLSVTNHFIAKGAPEPKRGAGYDRQERIIKTLTEKGGIISEADAMTLLSKVQLDYYHKLGWPVRTLWSAVYNSMSASVNLCVNQNYEEVFHFEV
ncbi:MAG: linear amide C-N hydrolase [Clostridia bacterium]|nr:linear amide C-N hydrolase [Clostridia bacterium]